MPRLNSFTIKQATDALKARNINNSYGAAYAPWVQIQDTISNRLLWVPPSVVALGALSSNDRIACTLVRSGWIHQRRIV